MDASVTAVIDSKANLRYRISFNDGIYLGFTYMVHNMVQYLFRGIKLSVKIWRAHAIYMNRRAETFR